MAEHKDEIASIYKFLWVCLYNEKLPQITVINFDKVNEEAIEQMKNKALKVSKDDKNKAIDKDFLNALHTLTDELHYIRAIKESTLCEI